MAAVWNGLERAYQVINYEWADPRSQHFPLVSRPFSVLAIIAAYVVMVKRIGPSFMRHRAPFRLKGALVVYNALQIAVNTYLCFMGFRYFWFSHYSWSCQPLETSTSPKSSLMLHLINTFFWLKISDLLDTVFFVLRKKDNQVTFLHVYHHSLLVFVAWKAIKYFPGGHGTLFVFVNTFVHAVMYTYYLLSALDPRAIWWKKFVTQIQLVQHVTGLIHLGILLFHNPCKFHLYPSVFMVPQFIIMIVLFMRFYLRAYSNKKSQNGKIH